MTAEFDRLLLTSTGDVYASDLQGEAHKLHPGLEDTVSELCDLVGIPATDDATPLSRLLQLQTALTSAQAQSGADPQMMLGSLAAVLLGLFDLLGVPAVDGERGLTLHERASRAVAVVRQGRSEPRVEVGSARLTASEEERQHLTAQLQQARTAVDAWTIECSRLAGQVTDLQARLAAAVEDAGSGVQARVAHALRTELNQVGILMSQGYLSPEMHAAVARVHWLMDLYHGPR